MAEGNVLEGIDRDTMGSFTVRLRHNLVGERYYVEHEQDNQQPHNWTSFDYGQVGGKTQDQARDLATEEYRRLHEAVQKAASTSP